MRISSETLGGGGLGRELGLADATAIIVGIVVGSGIFVAPAAVCGATASTWVALAYWGIGGLVAACGAFCYAECGARLPEDGGFYVFYREVFGGSVAFVSGWAALAITYPASLAAVALICAHYLGEVVPAAAGHESLTAVAAIAAVGAVNVIGVRAGAWTQRLLTTVKVVALSLLCGAALLTPGAHPVGLAPPTGATELSGTFAAVLTAFVAIMWTYDGWTATTMVSGELRDPGRNLGRSVTFGIAAVGVLYVLVQTAVNVLLSPEQAAGSERVFAEAIGVALGPRSARLVALLVVVCTLGSLNGTALTGARLGYAMARDRLLPSWFGNVHPRFRTPSRSVIGLSVAGILTVLSGSFTDLLSYFSFSAWIFYGLTAVSLLVLRRRRVGRPDWQAPLGSLPPAVMILSALGMSGGLLVEQPIHSFAALAILLAGFPAFWAWRSISRR